MILVLQLGQHRKRDFPHQWPGELVVIIPFQYLDEDGHVGVSSSTFPVGVHRHAHFVSSRTGVEGGRKKLGILLLLGLVVREFESEDGDTGLAFELPTQSVHGVECHAEVEWLPLLLVSCELAPLHLDFAPKVLVLAREVNDLANILKVVVKLSLEYSHLTRWALHLPLITEAVMDLKDSE